ncbi:hypothetical protein HanIR_Chr13g0626291 [Helianthus annuus]|nr:hypothetical protein HanIR_Chr13g0626291 [Helianthus annuus]
MAPAASENSCVGETPVAGDADEDAHEEDDDDVGDGETTFSGLTTGAGVIIFR